MEPSFVARHPLLKTRTWQLPRVYASPQRKPAVRAHLRRRPPPVPLPNVGAGSAERYVKSARHKDLKIFTRVWEPIVPATAGVLIIPGLQWHTGWFSTIAQPFSGQGIRVVGVDPLSTGRSDDLAGVRCFIESIDDHLDDFEAALDRLIIGLPAKAPVFVLAESSGGVIACMLALRPAVAEKVQAWILCAPALKLNPKLLPPRPVLPIVKSIGRKFPRLPLPGEDISGGSFDKAFGDGISHKIAKEDPYVLFRVPVRMGTGIAMMGAMDSAEKALREGQLWMRKLLVLHNRKDVRTLFSGSQGLVDRVRTEHGAELIDLGGDAHQLFQERVGVTQEAVKTILAFVEEARH